MKAQFKYAFRAHLTLRSAALAGTLIMNLVFGVLGYFDVYGANGKVTATVLSSLALCTMIAICFVTDYEMLNSMCSTPAGYVTVLPPVKSWKIILPKVITILAEDVVCFVIAISGVVLQALILSGEMGEVLRNGIDWVSLWILPVLLLGYIYLILIVLFGIVLSKSLFYSLRARSFLAVLAVAATAYVFSLLDIVLTPFGVLENVHMFYSVSLTAGANVGFIAYLLLSACKSAVLFLASSYLMERKINL